MMAKTKGAATVNVVRFGGRVIGYTGPVAGKYEGFVPCNRDGTLHVGASELAEADPYTAWQFATGIPGSKLLDILRECKDFDEIIQPVIDDAVEIRDADVPPIVDDLAHWLTCAQTGYRPTRLYAIDRVVECLQQF
jgi:hypothetical protein